VVGPGDELVLIMTGDVERTYSLPINREGFIVIPQVGQVWANGLSLERLRGQMYGVLGRSYSGIQRGPGATTFFELTLGRLRTNQVFVTGEVEHPGTYMVSPVASVLNALYLAGGPSSSGSFRNVQIVRGGNVVRRIDLYDYLLRGNNLSDVRLDPGDVIFVPVHGDQVAIHGQVTRSAIFELNPGDNLFSLLRYAGGVTTPAFLRRARIARVLPPAERVAPALDRVFMDVDLTRALADSTAAPGLRAGDDVAVFAIRDEVRNVVTIAGAVWREASYQYHGGMHLWDLVRLAEGLRVDAYLSRAHIVRMNPEDGTANIIPVSLDTLPDGTPTENPELQEFDGVTVYARTAFEPGHSIEVRGSVRSPGAQPRFEGMMLRDAILRAGGLERDTYTGRAFISRRQADLTRRAIPVTLTVDSLLIPLNADTLEDFDIIEVFGVARSAVAFPVGISGEVHQAFSGVFEEGMTLRDLVIRAGGLTPSSDLTLEVSRLAEGPDRRQGRIAEILTIRVDSSYILPEGTTRFYLGDADSLRGSAAADPGRSFRLRPYDYVLARRIPDLVLPRAVTVAGEVRYPGQHTLARTDERLREFLMTRAEGLKPNAYARGARLVRGGQLVNVDFEGVLRSARHSDNLALMPGDSIYVPEYSPIVLVQGAVNNPGAVLYRRGAGIDYYIAGSGGYARLADKGGTHVRQANGRTEMKSHFLLLTMNSPEPLPGSTIVVPALAREDLFDTRGFITDVLQIVSSLATVIFVLKR
jgi:protein involved in polysaccharide export with SLBB domain